MEALERYPDFTLTKLDFSVPRCDACHLGGRLSTVSGWLKGVPYDDLSFEVGFPLIIAVFLQAHHICSLSSTNMIRRTLKTRIPVFVVSTSAAFAQLELKYSMGCHTGM
jgi:Domain of unknown function (DUF4211)